MSRLERCKCNPESLLMWRVFLVWCICGNCWRTKSGECERIGCLSVTLNPPIVSYDAPSLSVFIELLKEPRVRTSQVIIITCEVLRYLENNVQLFCNVVWSIWYQHRTWNWRHEYLLYRTGVQKLYWEFIICDQLLRIGLYLNHVP